MNKFLSKNKGKKEDLTTNFPVYERINFLKYFKNNGYVKKVLCLYKDTRTNSDVVYYNDRDRTNIPCIDKDVFIISNYNHANNVDTYTLVQVDFSLPEKYKIIMSESASRGESYGHPKSKLYEYIRENNLVEIKDKPEVKSPQIDFGYGKIVLEILEGLFISNSYTDNYDKKQLFDLILNNVELSKQFLESAKSIESKRTMKIRVKNRLSYYYLDIIFEVINKDKISISDAIYTVKRCQENYYYNI